VMAVRLYELSLLLQWAAGGSTELEPSRS